MSIQRLLEVAMIKSYPEGNLERGTWKELRTSFGLSACFVCPDCGQIGVLTDHEILVDGTVQPSVVCDTAGCSFHEFIRLDGWTE